MPPKKKGSAKAEKKRQEAERKAREEAEAAEAAERERLEQLERERLEREAEEQQRAEEEVLFKKENARLNDVMEEQMSVLEQWKSQKLEEKQWEGYTSCRVLPDPSNEMALNSYLSLCAESSLDSHSDIEGALNTIQDYLKLCSEIEELLHGDGLPQPTEAVKARYTETISQLHQLVLNHLDTVSLQYMKEAELHVDTETYNLRVEASIPEGLVYCIWGNVVKDPRLKSFSFLNELKFTLDLPKPLLLADVSVRVIQLPFDLLSPLSQSFACKRSPQLSSVIMASMPSDKTGAPSNEGTNKGMVPNNQDNDEGWIASGRQSAQPANMETEELEIGDAEIKDKFSEQQEEPVNSDSYDPGGSNGESGEECDAGEGGEECDVGGGGEECDAEDDLEADEVNLRAFLPACGPIIFDLLEMPPQSKSVNNWTFRQVVPSHLIHYPYPAEVPRPSPSSAEEEEQRKAPPAPTPGSSSWPTITITMQLPERFVFSIAPQLAQWDAERQCWRTGGFREISCNLDERTVSFQLFYFRPLALMMDRYSNMPYLSWSLLPCGPNHTQLTIEGANLAITVDIREHESTLIGPTDLPALSHILNKPMSARQLIKALSGAGANFFPELDAENYVSVTVKDPVVEHCVYQSIVLACGVVGFQWSRWNSEASESSIVLRAVQTMVAPTDANDVDQLDWSTYVCGRRNYKVAIGEDGDEFSENPTEGCEVQSSLYSVLEQEASGCNLTTTSPIHCEAVRHWITTVKMLTFS